jgi:hypothetical protein
MSWTSKRQKDKKRQRDKKAKTQMDKETERQKHKRGFPCFGVVQVSLSGFAD